MFDEVNDYKLQRLFKNKIAQSRDDVKLLKSIFFCGAKVLRLKQWKSSVYVVKNETTAKIWGTTTCKNSWCCPVCSARMMSIYAADIAAAIDALKAQGQVAVMFTFTIPHTSGMSCEESTEIIYNVWKNFIVHGNKLSGGTKRDVFPEFCMATGCKHRVRVGEYTWGAHGWHPHFHCLFWVDKDKLDVVKQWRELLNARWMELAKRWTLKEFDERYPEKKADNATRVDIMYSKIDVESSKGCYLSVDDADNVIVQESSMYICGWGADKEVTGNYSMKATHPQHMTPFQILEKADETGDDKWLNLYMEYARAVRRKKHMRINFSTRSGIRSIIAKWKLTEAYRTVLKKKQESLGQACGRWTVVVWFTDEQWQSIYFMNPLTGIIERILKAAMEADGRKRIQKMLMDELNIDISANKETVYTRKQVAFVEFLLNGDEGTFNFKPAAAAA